MDTLIKKAFVKKILTEEGETFDKNQSAAIGKLLNFHSHKLETGRSYSVTSGNELDGKLTMSIPAYGRVLDIKPKNRKYSSINRKNLNDRRVKRKAYPIYNRFVFGHYNTIAYRLMYGLTNEVADNIKNQFKPV